MIFNSGRNDELYGKRCVLDDELLKSPANLAMQDIKWDIEQWRNYMQKAITPRLHKSCEKAIATWLHASRYHTSVARIMLLHIGSTNHAKMLKVRTIQKSGSNTFLPANSLVNYFSLNQNQNVWGHPVAEVYYG